MDIHISAGDFSIFVADTLIIGLFEDAPDNPPLVALEGALGGEIARLRALNDFGGEFNATLTLYPGNMIPAGRVVVVGLGKADAMNPARATEAMATAVKAADGLGAKQVATPAPAPAGGREVMVAEAMVVGSKLALYRYDRFKTFGEMVDKPVNIEALTMVVAEGDAVEPIATAAAAGAAIADAVADCEGVDGDLLPLRVIHVAPRPPATLTVTLSDGTVNEINLEDQLWGSYEPLKDPALFAQAGVNDQTGLVQWPNGLDLPLDMLLL